MLRALVVQKEERFVFLDGPTKSAAEDVAAERIALGPGAIVEVAVRVHFIVAQKLEDIAVQLIGPALDRHDYARAADVAVFAASVAGDHLHFFQGVDVGLVADTVADCFAGFHAVEQEVVGLLPIAVDLWAAAAALESGRSAHHGRRRTDGARDQQRQRREVAAVQRKRRELDGVDRIARRRRLRLKNRRGAADLDGLCHLANFHLEVDAGNLVDFEREGAHGGSLEAAVLGGDVIASDREKRQVVNARAVSLRRVGQCRAGVGGHHLYIGDSGAAGVGHRSGDRCSHVLGMPERGENTHLKK